jgi:hypothetical protein
MRCTRCHGLVIPQSVGLLPDGTVVFGWCRGCLDEEDCKLVEVPGKGFDALARPRRMRAQVRKLAQPPKVRITPSQVARAPRMKDRSLPVAGIAGLLALWGIILMALGVVRLPAPFRANPLPNGESRFLLASGGMLAVVSLCVWAATLERAWLRKVALEAVRITSTIIAAATLLWGVVNHAPRENPVVVSIAALAIAVAWVTHWFEHKRTAPAPATTSSTSLRHTAPQR